MQRLASGSPGCSSAARALPRTNGVRSPSKPYFVSRSRASISTSSISSGSNFEGQECAVRAREVGSTSRRSPGASANRSQQGVVGQVLSLCHQHQRVGACRAFDVSDAVGDDHLDAAVAQQGHQRMGARRTGGFGVHRAARPRRRQVSGDRGDDGECRQGEQQLRATGAAAAGGRLPKVVEVTGPAPMSSVPQVVRRSMRSTNATADGHRGRRSSGRRLGCRDARRR